MRCDIVFVCVCVCVYIYIYIYTMEQQFECLVESVEALGHGMK